MGDSIPRRISEEVEESLRADDEIDKWEDELNDLEELLPLVGDRMPDHYRLISYVGRGGTGHILGVENVNLGEKRALKVPRPRFARESEVIDLIENEVDKLQSLSHTNIIDVYFSATVTYNGRDFPFFIMEYITGNNIVEFMEERNPSTDEILVIWESVFSAMEYIHKNGLIHSDIKPENILVKENGTPVIVDYGFAKHLKEGEAQTPVGGTDPYMHPDPRSLEDLKKEEGDSNLVRGDIPRPEVRKYGYKMDMYSLGLTLLEACRVLITNNSNSISTYELTYMRLLGCRMLDGQNDGDELGLDLDAMKLGTDIYEEINYTHISDVKKDWRKLTGSYNLESHVPEISLYSRNTITVSTVANTPFTERVRDLVNADDVSRLGSIPQLGLMNLIYPAANHSRLEHALGTFSILCKYIDALYNDDANPLFRQLMDEDDIAAVLVSSLVHDIGQFPLAYDIKKAQPKIHPKNFTIELLKNSGELANIIEDSDRWGVPTERIINILASQPDDPSKMVKDRILNSLIDGPLGASRIDYLIRDSQTLGLPYANSISFNKLPNSLTVIVTASDSTSDENDTYCGVGIYEDEQIVTETIEFVHYAMLSDAYWHHTHRSIKAMLRRLVYETFPDGEGDKFEDFKNLVNPSGKPVQESLGEDELQLSDIDPENTSQVHLPDLEVLKWLEFYAKPPATNLSKMIEERKLFKRVYTFTRVKATSKEMEMIEDVQIFVDKCRARRTESPSRIADFQDSFQKFMANDIREALGEELSEQASSVTPVTQEAANTYLEDCMDQIVFLVDIPSEKEALGTKVRYLEEAHARGSELNSYSTSVFDDDSIGGFLKQSYHDSIGKLRIYCHPDHAEFVSAYFDRSDVIKHVQDALEDI